MPRTRSRIISTGNLPFGNGSNRSTSNVTTSSWKWGAAEPAAKKFTSIETIVDEQTPGFSEIVKKNGLRPINPLTQTKEGTYSCSLFYEAQGVTGNALAGWVFSRAWAGMVSHNPNPFTTLEKNSARVKARARFNGESIDALTSTVEFHKTVSMVVNARRNLVTTVMRALREWKKTKPSGVRSLRDAWDSFSSFWLEYRYGWRILYYEISAVDDYLRHMKDGVVIVPARETLERETFTETRFDANLSTAFRLFRGVSSTHKYRCGVVGTIDRAVISTPNLPRTAWELIPFSFVVDWFVAVGDIIDAFIPAKGRSTLATWESYEVTSLVSHRVQDMGVYKNVRRCEIVEKGDLVATSRTRTKGTEPWPIPPLNVNLNPGQILDLATLMKSIVSELKTVVRRK